MLMPQVSRYMTLHPQAIGPRAKLSTARELMRRTGVHHLPVVDHDRVVGVVSDRDLHQIHRSHGGLVSDAMTEPAVTASKDMPLDAALELMQAKSCHSLVIVGKAGVEGIFTTADALRALGDVLRRTVEEHP
jgi:acetoin utilization protein AcuB